MRGDGWVEGGGTRVPHSLPTRRREGGAVGGRNAGLKVQRVHATRACLHQGLTILVRAGPTTYQPQSNRDTSQRCRVQRFDFGC